MAIESFREYCLSFKGVEEIIKFPESLNPYVRDILIFSVVNKWFCFVNIVEFDFCDLKCDPNESLELQEQYEGITSGYHMNKKHWISVYFNSDVPDHNIMELVKKSYELVVNGLSKKEKSLLSGADI